MKKLLISCLVLLSILDKPVFACLSCGCESSGSSSDLSSLGAGSGIFSKGKSFLVQFGSSLKNINGSFNENGVWNNKPSDSSILSLQNTLGLMYFPTKELSFGLQIPLISNFLSGASWGAFGSISPTDITNTLVGTSIGDLNLQGTYKFYENNEFDLASVIWIRTGLPTGAINVNSENMTGNGIFSLSGGAFAIKKLYNFEFLANVGYQLPLAKIAQNTGYFSVGNAFLYQLQTNYQIKPELKVGLGINGILGNWLLTNNEQNMSTGKIRLNLSAQYDLTMFNGIGLNIGYDPQILGKNSMTDSSLNVVFYQYL
jgi:hypothetical protein